MTIQSLLTGVWVLWRCKCRTLVGLAMVSFTVAAWGQSFGTTKSGPNGGAFGPKQAAGPGNPLGLNPTSPLNAQNPNSFSSQMTRLQQQQQLQKQQQPLAQAGVGSTYSSTSGTTFGTVGQGNAARGMIIGMMDEGVNAATGSVQAVDGRNPTQVASRGSVAISSLNGTGSSLRNSPSNPRVLVSPSPTKPSL